jgi:SAM-dependent methyltransferase
LRKLTGGSDLRRRASHFWVDGAEKYDQHDHGSEHEVARSILSDHIARHNWKTLLDVGCGTGRILGSLRERHPDLELTGVEPVHEMLLQARRRPGLGSLVEADGARLPFADRTFDVVTEFAVLHHLVEPSPMVAEMMRVARYAVLLSDTNRYGIGPYPIRLVKLIASRLGVWPMVFWLNTRGRGHYESDGDGISYSYSVFDSVRMCSDWGRTRVIATRPPNHPHPLLGASHALLVTLRS